MPAEAQPFRPLPQPPYIEAEKPVITIADAWFSFETSVARAAELADLVTSALFRRAIPLPRRKQPPSPWALRGINLLVYPGEAMAITGDREGGRSALLALIGSANPPPRGTVRTVGRISPILNSQDSSLADRLPHLDILLLDQPASMKTFSSEAIEFLRRCREERRTVFIATSDSEDAGNLCTRRLVFHDGALIRDEKNLRPCGMPPPATC